MLPADEVAGFVVLGDEARRLQRLVHIALLERNRAQGARAAVHAAEYRAILQRDEAARPQQIRSLADAMGVKFGRVVLTREISVVNFRLLWPLRKGVTDVDDVEVLGDGRHRPEGHDDRTRRRRGIAE